jgi:hypothetical protein
MFVLASASLALAAHGWRNPSPQGWIFWVTVNGATALSGFALWFFSARHMYYPGILEHWGAHGWRGFPDWGSFSKIWLWLFTRPLNIGNYGNRGLGIVLSLLAIAGGIELARRQRAAMITLLAAPFLAALAAALLGKYPLVDRTAFFLLPCLWLLAACGIEFLAAWGRRRGCEAGGLAVLLIAWDLFWVVAWSARPDPATDYRGAYEFINARKQRGDTIWTSPAVVYEIYYGADPQVIGNSQTLRQAVEMTDGRLWMFIGKGQLNQLQPFIAAGRHVILQQHVAGGDIVLLDAKNGDAGQAL